MHYQKCLELVKGIDAMKMNLALSQRLSIWEIQTDEKRNKKKKIFNSHFRSNLLYHSLVYLNQMDINHSTGNKMPSQEHLNFINKLNDSKIPRQNQLIANRLFMKNFPREVTSKNIFFFYTNSFFYLH
jgi:hypothetical protein